MQNLWIDHLRFRKIYYVAILKRRQWLKEDDLKQDQEEKLKKIIRHAYNNVPFYRDLFKSIRLKPSDIKTVCDLKKLPIISKKEVRENYPHRIIAKGLNPDNCVILKTTGSTGTPLKICYSHKNRNYRSALFHYIYFELGRSLFDKSIKISGEPSVVKYSFLNKFNFLKTKNISIFDSLENIVKKLIEIKPNVICTYPSMLSLLAKKIKAKNISGIRPKLIITIGETLTNSYREELCKIFETDIFRHYGSEEFGTLAFECQEHSGYHILTDNVVIEFISENEDVDFGNKGEVIVTGLTNYNMPLIRYKLGDIAIPLNDRCRCGRRFPLIQDVAGREDDFLLLPSGRMISPRMINVIENIEGVKAYKTIQETEERFVVQLVKGEGFSEKTINEVKKQIIKGCLGEKIKVDVDLVNEIAKERTGKIRTIVSKVKPQLGI